MAEASPDRFLTRGVLARPCDLTSWDWVTHAASAGLTTVGTHCSCQELLSFLASQEGQAFRERLEEAGLRYEHEGHALDELLPRDRFDTSPGMFRMDASGSRVPDANLCVHSEEGLELVCRNAADLAARVRPTTHRHFLWIDDGKPMCRCPRCRELSDSEQALLLENAVLRAVREVDPEARLAHLAYLNTLDPPTRVRPDPGIFLEYAPIWRRYDRPFSDRSARLAPDRPDHGAHLDALDANLAVFGSRDAQVLEYWLDASRFARWKEADVTALPWDGGLFADDVRTYASRGIRHVTTFAVYVNGAYVGAYGPPPLADYARILGQAGTGEAA